MTSKIEIKTKPSKVVNRAVATRALLKVSIMCASCVGVLKTGCVVDGKICMSQRKIMKTLIALEKNVYFIMKTLLI